MNPDLAPAQPAPFVVHLVTGGGSSPELALLLRSLAAARVVALDGEWKPRRRGPADPGDDTSPAPAQPTQPKFPTVTLLQVACRGDGGGGGEVFVVDLLAVPLADLWAPLRELFERPEVLKLGFRFKQDLVYLSATFAAALGSDAGFDRVEPFLDVTNVYYYLKGHDRHKRLPKETKSLATICEEVLNVSLSKELQCSDWSCRPLSEGELLNQTYKEGRILLTRDLKLLKYQYLASNQVYRVKSLLKHDQLAEVIDNFQLKISEDQLMSRCTKCNGSFIQKPLTLEEAIEASKGFQVIPSCLFNRNLEFWKCTDCNQLYWEGTQYHNAVQKFLSVCNISD